MDNYGEDSVTFGRFDATTMPLPAVADGPTTPPRQSSDISQSTHSSMPPMVDFSPDSWDSQGLGANAAPASPDTEGARRAHRERSPEEIVRRLDDQNQVLAQSLKILMTLVEQQRAHASPPQATPASTVSRAAGGMKSLTSLGVSAVDTGNIAVNMVITKKGMPDKDKHPGYVTMDEQCLHVDPLSISKVRGIESRCSTSVVSVLASFAG